jgi:MinD-like ATPase involved in chromosome partitioning or flagellar assembly
MFGICQFRDHFMAWRCGALLQRDLALPSALAYETSMTETAHAADESRPSDGQGRVGPKVGAPEASEIEKAAVLEEARRLVATTVVDCGFNLEDDEELSFDTAAPRRNGATLAVLEGADTVLCVSGADPVALQRSIRALGELRDALPDVEPLLVVNQVRRGPVPGDVRREIGEALERFAGREVRFFLTADRRATDAALASGRTLAEVAPGSPLRAELRALAAALADVTLPVGRRRGPRRTPVAG